MCGHTVRPPIVNHFTRVAASFQFLQEILANHIAGVPTKKVSKDAPAYERFLAAAKIDSKPFKMALYGFFVSAPLGHALVGRLQKAFAGQTGTKAKVLQILASNLITAPIQITGQSFGP